MININRITMKSYWKEKINIIVIIKNNRLYIFYIEVISHIYIWMMINALITQAINETFACNSQTDFYIAKRN